jgi:large subunit ribosomal protein L24
MANINPKLIGIPKHRRDKMIGARLDKVLRGQYKRRSTRVVKGDSVKVIRGEYKGVEGKVENVNTEHGTLHIEGISREKIKGGQVKVPIHASNVMVTALNLSDKYRSRKLQGEGKHVPADKKKIEKKEKRLNVAKKERRDMEESKV